jgi:SAM-dependent methyltransferase
MVMSPSAVVWHELECGSYRADLPLWRELAALTASGGGSARVLDVGAGTGRVALELARAGHLVTALDLDDELLEALRQRVGGTRIDTVCADARSFELSRCDFDLCLVPMQTVQLLRGPTERVAFLRRARAHLRRGGMLAMAIVTEVEPFDCAAGDAGPSPEIAHLGEAVYTSRPTRVSVLGTSVLIERQRRAVLGREPAGAETGGQLPGPPEPERSVVELRLVDASELEREAIAAGLHRERVMELSPTEEHVGSTVVIVRA